MKGIAAAGVPFGYILGVIGPLSTSLAGLKLFMKTALAAKPWLSDPTLVPLPWRGEQRYLRSSGRKVLKVGVLWDDGVVKPHPPIIRSLKEVVQRMKESDGIDVVDWKPYNHHVAWQIIVSSAWLPLFESKSWSSSADSLQGKFVLVRWWSRNKGVAQIERRTMATAFAVHPPGKPLRQSSYFC